MRKEQYLGRFTDWVKHQRNGKGKAVYSGRRRRNIKKELRDA